VNAPEVRASDADRDRVATQLREHLTDGRLTLDELSERLDAAYRARTVGELEEITRDLPAAALPPAETGRTRGRWVVAVMSGVERKRRWRVPERLNALTLMGAMRLDLRQAVLSSPEVEIAAVCVMGGIEIVVPEGVEVEVSGFAIIGGRDERIADVPVLPGGPRIHVRAYVLMGGVDVRSKPRKALPPGQ
jgi:hypothetical protein